MRPCGSEAGAEAAVALMERAAGTGTANQPFRSGEPATSSAVERRGSVSGRARAPRDDDAALLPRAAVAPVHALAPPQGVHPSVPGA